MAITNFRPTIWHASLLENLHQSAFVIDTLNHDYEGDIQQGGDDEGVLVQVLEERRVPDDRFEVGDGHGWAFLCLGLAEQGLEAASAARLVDLLRRHGLEIRLGEL